jgi:uncharacterized protein YbjT (DUF2867 family)
MHGRGTSIAGSRCNAIDIPERMKILITGATGFIGQRLCKALIERGHEVVGVARSAPGSSGFVSLSLDVSRVSVDEWRGHLQGVDAVVNAVGIFRESRTRTFQSLHIDAARRLFEACVLSGVGRVIQLSALGADEGATTEYHLSKRAADEFLLGLPLNSCVVQPSLVFGGHGTSARMFLAWASLPVLPLPAGGEQRVQPVHVSDVIDTLLRLVDRNNVAAVQGRLAVVGPMEITLRGYLQALRAGLHLPPARTLAIPAPIMSTAARVGDEAPGMLFNSEAWRMLERGNTASPGPMSAMLGRPPRAIDQFIDEDTADLQRNDARLTWLLPGLRLSIAIVWIVTGIVSLGLYPVDDSFELLARAGVPRSLLPLMLYGAATFDLCLGIATLIPWKRRRVLWLTQALLIVFYTVVISVHLPEFWLHPYGPVLKNIPMLALLLLLAMLEPPLRERP